MRVKDLPIKCNKGAVSEKPKPESEYENKIGEWEDVWCVAKGEKPLAGLNYSNYGIKQFFRRERPNQELIREIIDYANSEGVQALHMKKEGGMYLKTIVFKPRQFENAKKLMYILWFDQVEPDPYFAEYAIGKLFGYSLPNIRYYLKTRLGFELTSDKKKRFDKTLKELKVSMEDLPQVSRYYSIPPPDISVSKREKEVTVKN